MSSYNNGVHCALSAFTSYPLSLAAVAVREEDTARLTSQPRIQPGLRGSSGATMPEELHGHHWRYGAGTPGGDKMEQKG